MTAILKVMGAILLTEVPTIPYVCVSDFVATDGEDGHQCGFFSEDCFKYVCKH